MVSSLDRKLLRDLARIWAQALAIAFVVAGGVATLLMSVGSQRSLEETRTAYYERYRFADVFASVTRAPRHMIAQLAEIPGASDVEARIMRFALLDVPDFKPPVTAQFLSLPDNGSALLNRLHLRLGRLPDPGRQDEVVLNDPFASAHGLAPGSVIFATLNGRRRALTVVGTALSPEYVYAIGPGDIMPDDQRFGIVWMAEKALAAAYDLQGAFSQVSLKLLRGASEREVIQRVDALLERYGGRGAFGRKDQTSHAFLDHELDMLSNMSRTLPPIFLLVSAFLINLTMSRLIALEREQIGLLKAVGYGNGAIAWHYVKLVALIVMLGIVIGGVAGTWLGGFITELFGRFFHFPFLIFSKSPALYLLAGVLGLLAAGLGAWRAVVEALRLPPAVAMQPPVPPLYRRGLLELPLRSVLSQPAMMTLRHITRHPLRALFSFLGLALATGILVVSLFTRDTMEQLIDVTYFLADRYDATLSFVEKRGEVVVGQVRRLPGVTAAEPFREVPVRIRRGSIERRLVLTGRPADADLSRIIDVNLRAVSPPADGLAISSMLGSILGVRPGDELEVDILDGTRRTLQVPVVALVEDFFGLRAMMELDALNRIMRDGAVVSGVRVSTDRLAQAALDDAIKGLPVVAASSSQTASLENFRKTVALLITTMGGIYTGLAAIIAFGVVYNSARIALSERARELASLRVLGFSRTEVSRILLLELVLLAVLAQPLGWVIGYGLAAVMRNNLAGELMRVRLVVENLTYVMSSMIVLTAAAVSAAIVVRRIGSLDLIAVLKTRD